MPQRLDDPRFVQQLLVDLAYQQARADSAEQKAEGWKKQATDWKQLYEDETKRSSLLKGAGEDRKDAQGYLNIAVATLTAQHNEDKAFIAEQNTYIRGLEKSRFKFALVAPVVSFGAGYGACALQNAFPGTFGR